MDEVQLGLNSVGTLVMDGGNALIQDQVLRPRAEPARKKRKGGGASGSI